MKSHSYQNNSPITKHDFADVGDRSNRVETIIVHAITQASRARGLTRKSGVRRRLANMKARGQGRRNFRDLEELASCLLLASHSAPLPCVRALESLDKAQKRP